ncbi:GNAT family N-acetyltransferase [Lentibacillus sp. L22]|uniref:GNAT family N-acetyltransferase n=1 Tax=Lentibacillus TaxID=175304 RepID=UPI0022B0A306|nr:GNAT family N-acetyltransferase [Lentibacillus daqui]
MTLMIKTLETIDELQQMQEVESEVWHMDPIPVHQTFTALNHGGIVLGAYDGEKMVGFLYSFAGFDRGTPYLCSHMLGILPEYRTSGLGVKFKWKQAEIAKKMGYSMITWTFDPLESRNAYLNLHKLQATGALYEADHYGSMNDEFNQGLPTDRIQIKWDISNQKSQPDVSLQAEHILLDADENGYPIVKERLETANLAAGDCYFVAIPKHFQGIKQTDFSLAKQWRLETRKVFQQLFDHGFQASDLIREAAHDYSYYVFTN